MREIFKALFHFAGLVARSSGVGALTTYGLQALEARSADLAQTDWRRWGLPFTLRTSPVSSIRPEKDWKMHRLDPDKVCRFAFLKCRCRHWTTPGRGCRSVRPDKLLGLALKEKDAASYVRSAVRFTDSATTRQAFNDVAVLLGSEAWKLARELRAQYEIPASRFNRQEGDALFANRSAVLKRLDGLGTDPYSE